MRNILVNAVDQPEECSFIVPSVIRRGDLLIAISTSGKSPAMARKIREALADQFGKEYEYFLNIMGRVRMQLLSKDISEDERGRIFHDLVDSDLLELIRKQDIVGVASEMERKNKRWRISYLQLPFF
jgi:precorrin-2 dehydrogenase/sirohydrochlorin ferrochelatase